MGRPRDESAGQASGVSTVVKRLDEIPSRRSSMPTNVGTTYYQRAFERGVDGIVGPWECVDYMTIPAGTQFGEHVHDGSEELYFILEGTGTALLDGTERRVGPGDLLMLRDGGCHGLRNDGPGPVRLLCVCVYLGDDHRLIPAHDGVPLAESGCGAGSGSGEA